MNFLSVIGLVALLLSSQSFAKGHYGRFWRGEEQASFPKYEKLCDNSKKDCFEYFVNQWLIPATPSYAARDALTGYAPVILPKSLSDKYQDEFALILYSTQEDYDILRGNKVDPNTEQIEPSTEDLLIKVEGKYYGPIHGEIFDSKTLVHDFSDPKERDIKRSRSLIPKEYSGMVVLEGPMKDVSYDLFSNAADIPNLSGAFFIKERSKNLDPGEFSKELSKALNEVKKQRSKLGLEAAYVLANQDYITGYFFFDEDSKRNQFEANLRKLNVFNGIAENTWSTNLVRMEKEANHPLTYTYIERGEGGNLFFNKGQKPGHTKHPLLYKY